VSGQDTLAIAVRLRYCLNFGLFEIKLPYWQLDFMCPRHINV